MAAPEIIPLPGEGATMPDAAPAIPTQPTPQAQRADILWAVASPLSPDDQLRLGAMADLAQRGYGLQLLRATELVRVRPGKAQRLHDLAGPDDPARHVLGAVLGIRGSDMLATGITPSEAALTDLRRNELYALRERGANTATRNEAYKLEAFRWYQIGCTAIVAARQRLPSRHELGIAHL